MWRRQCRLRSWRALATALHLSEQRSVPKKVHIVEQTVVSAPGLQILDVPMPQMGDQLVDVFKIIDTSLPIFAEQVIGVPKIFLQDTSPQRSVQTVDIPVHGGVKRGGGSLLVFLRTAFYRVF